LKEAARGKMSAETIRGTGPFPTHSTEAYAKELVFLADPFRSTTQVAAGQAVVTDSESP